MTDMTLNDPEISAGEFSAWLDLIRTAQKTGEPIDVPCGDCTACCTSSYFIHIKSQETETKSKIPAKLIFPAPGMPKGNVLMGFSNNGHCPMFADNRCSIYDYRPQTCRVYDCRIFTATGIKIDKEKVLISRQIRRWKFDFRESGSLKKFDAVQSAAGFINEFAGRFPRGFIPVNPPQRAMLAIKIYDFFLDCNNNTEQNASMIPEEKTINAIIDVYNRFESNRH